MNPCNRNWCQKSSLLEETKIKEENKEKKKPNIKMETRSGRGPRHEEGRGEEGNIQQEDRPPTLSIRPREFDGTGSWEDFKCHFERVSAINKWNTNKLEYLWVHLAGPALAYVDGLPSAQTSSYELMCEALERRFSCARMASIYQAELESRVREPGESLPALGQDIRKLVTKAYPELSGEAAEVFTIRSFVHAIPDPEQRLRIHEGAPKTLEEAIQLAITREAWQAAERRRNRSLEQHGYVRAVTTENGEKESKVMKKIMERLEALEKMEEERRAKRSIVCYNCKGKGHIAKNCRKPSANQQENDGQSH